MGYAPILDHDLRVKLFKSGRKSACADLGTSEMQEIKNVVDGVHGPRRLSCWVSAVVWYPLSSNHQMASCKDLKIFHTPFFSFIYFLLKMLSIYGDMVSKSLCLVAIQWVILGWSG